MNVFSTAIPLIGVLALTATKDGYDDIVRDTVIHIAQNYIVCCGHNMLILTQKRHISDWHVNHRVAHVLNPITMT